MGPSATPQRLRRIALLLAGLPPEPEPPTFEEIDDLVQQEFGQPPARDC